MASCSKNPAALFQAVGTDFQTYAADFAEPGVALDVPDRQQDRGKRQGRVDRVCSELW